MHNYYKVLGVSTNAKASVIKIAYRKKALIEHPDKGGDPIKMALLTIAYQTLIDPIQRLQFDKDWEAFNADNEYETSKTPRDFLCSAGTAFSETFRMQHSELIHEYLQKPLQRIPTMQYLKPFDSKLYNYSNNDKTHADIFSFVQQNKTSLSTFTFSDKTLTPEIAVECFYDFLKGDHSMSSLRNISREFCQKIKQQAYLGQASHEFQLYLGIYEIFLVAVKEKVPSENILLSLHKITKYAKHNAEQCMGLFEPILQSNNFRSLFSQSLHLYWLSDENVLEVSFLKLFDGQSAAAKLIEKLKLKISENRAANKTSETSTKALQYARLLYNLEMDFQKRARVTHKNRAWFYREKAFHLLDWLPAVMWFADDSITVNTLLQIGIILQRAAAQESTPVLQMADEILASKIYLLAAGIGNGATPDVELYACVHSVKCMMSCHYSDSTIKETMEELQQRALWLADLFPFLKTPQSNTDFLAEDRTVILMRTLLHALIDKINGATEPTEKLIDHSYVRIFYQAFEACLKNWYRSEQNPEEEEIIRQRLMQELLSSKNWTTISVDFNLNAPWSLNSLDDGWTCHETSLPVKADVSTYRTINGVELNYKTGEIEFILDNYNPRTQNPRFRLLSLLDLNELFQRRLASCYFSLDEVDPDMPYHPFNQMRFKPSKMYSSLLLHTMLLSDYLLKFLAVGQEVQCCYPYKLRSLNEMTRILPEHLKKVLYDFHASNHGESLNRFWIESEEVELAVDDEGLNTDGRVLFALGNIKMVVKHRKLTRDVEGNLIDKEDEDEGWACYVLNKHQIRELKLGKRIIKNSALIFTEETLDLFTWENQKETFRCTLEEDESDVITLRKLERDDQEKVKTEIYESLHHIYKVVLKTSKKTGFPHRYSPEFIFAQEFTKYYNEFAEYFPEFGRLRELSKAMAVVNILAAHRKANQVEIQLTKNRLKDKLYWKYEEHEYWKTMENKLTKLIRESITKQFEEWRRKLSKERLTQSRQKSLNDIRQQIGTLHFNRFSPEIKEICDKYYEQIKRKIIAEHGYSGWNSVYHTVREEAIEPKIPEIISDLTSHKKKACREQLVELFKDEFLYSSSYESSYIINQFLDNKDKPLLDHLVVYDRKQVASKIKEVYPEHTAESLDRALNNSMLRINEIVVCETEKALKEHKQHLKIRLSERESLEKSFVGIGFEVDTEEIDLTGTCLWVPASYRHEVGKKHSRSVYGGVRISGAVKYINPDYVKIWLKQTTKKNKTLWKNKITGDAYRDMLADDLRTLGFEIITEVVKHTPEGIRRIDLEAWKDGKCLGGIEVKTGDSEHILSQRRKNKWLKILEDYNVTLLRFPKF